MYAYTNATGEVVATSGSEYTLAQAQAINADITAVIANAPAGLVIKGDQTAAQPFYHQHTSGDGTAISHYVEVLALKPLKMWKAAQIDARTEELIAAGFLASNGKRFRIDDRAMCRYQILFESRNNAGLTYPILINVYDNDGVQSLGVAAAVVAFVEEVYLGHQAIIASGAALKQQVIDATTVAEINAVVDNR